MNIPTIIESPYEDNGTEHRDTMGEIAAAAIRKRSAASQIISESEILGLLKDQHPALLDGNRAEEDISAILTQLVLENEDLHKFTGTVYQCYYSSHYMTEAYAKILLHKLDGPLRLVAETVRQNAREYQRPVPLDIFTKPPFDLAHQEILGYLATMATTAGYDDIATTSTSALGIYLYSTSHLEREHAAMLAEWLDVGQFNSP
jgi:hypothetical protein